MGITGNALVSSNGGSVRHYGYYNSAMDMWVPLCGQCTSTCTSMSEEMAIGMEGHKIDICVHCISHQIHDPWLEKAGLERNRDTFRAGRTFEVVDADLLADSKFTVDREQFKTYRKKNREDKIA